MKSYIELINENNPDNLPIVIMNENWCEGSQPRYMIGDCLNTAKNYDDFIKKTRKKFKGVKILFCRVGNYLASQPTEIWEGVVV